MITARVASVDITTLQQVNFYVTNKQEVIAEEFAPEPYTTATLLQDAITLYGWSSSQVMQAAQWLFENGLITYPRTDSISVAPEASDEARKITMSLFGKEVLNSKKRWDQMENRADGAHEAIRPTSSARMPHQLSEEIGADERQLYALIWKRFIAGYMIPAKFRIITVDLESDEDPSRRT
jgi:DNA topoisomerase-1